MAIKHGYSTYNQINGATRQIALPPFPAFDKQTFTYQFIMAGEQFGLTGIYYLFCCEGGTISGFDALDVSNVLVISSTAKYEVYQTIPTNDAWEDATILPPTQVSGSLIALAVTDYVYWTSSDVINYELLANYNLVYYSCTYKAIEQLTAPDPIFEVGAVDLDVGVTSCVATTNIQLVQNSKQNIGIYSLCWDLGTTEESPRVAEFKLYETTSGLPILIASNSYLIDPAYKFYIATYAIDKTTVGVRSFQWLTSSYMNSQGYLTGTGGKSEIITVTIVPIPEEQKNQHNFIQGWLMGQKMDIFNPNNKTRAWIEEQEDCFVIYQVSEAQPLNPYLEVN